MKLKLITLAVAATLAAPSAFAVANPEAVNGVQKIILSGATAPDGFIESSVKEMLEPGYKSYRDNANATLAFQHQAWYGKAKAGIPGVTAGTDILFVKRSKGGSVWGVDPVARASRIESLDFSACTVGGVDLNGRSYDYFCPTKGLDPDSPNFNNPLLNNGVPSDFGVSDVSPALFKAPFNVEFNQSELSVAEVAKLTVKPVNTLMMGLVVTNSVPLSTVITRADYGNMLMGNIIDWSQIYDRNFDGINDFDGSANDFVNTNVVVCRRVNGSGTQASYNWFFNNFPCESAFNGSMTPSTMGTLGSGGNNVSGIVGGTGTSADPYLIDPSAGYTVLNNSTSGDVRNCLARAQSNTAHNFKGDDGLWYRAQFNNTPGVPFKAIGVLSVDSYGSESGWTFRNIYGAGSFTPATQTGSAGATGIAPSKANLLSGAWDFAVELTMQYRNANVTNVQGDVITPLTGVKQAFADELIKRAGDPAKIALNSKLNAYAALPDNYSPYDGGDNAAQVALGSHQGNMCRPMVRKF